MPLNVYIDVKTYVLNRHDIKNAELRVYLIGWVDDLDPDEMQYDISEDLGKFFDYLEAMNDKYNGIYLHAYNLDYEIKALLPYYFQQLRYKNHITNHDYKLSADCATYISWTFSAETVGNRKCCLKITGIDLQAWRRHMSLDNWCKELGFEAKGTIDYDKNNVKYIDYMEGFTYWDSKGNMKHASLESELEYLEIDVLVLPKIKQKIKTQHYETLKILGIYPRHNYKDVFFGHTVAGFSTYVVEKYLDKIEGVNYSETNRYKTDNIELIKSANFSNLGGFTAFNKSLLSVEKKPIEYYGVNSMYPHIMTNRVCYGPLKPNRTHSTDQVWYIIKGTFVDWIDKYSYISQTLIDKERLGIGIFVTQQLYDLVKKLTNNDLSIVATYHQSTDYILKDLVRDLYELVNVLSEENAIAAPTIKLILNSLYGNCSQKTHFKEMSYIYDKDTNRAYHKTKQVDLEKTLAKTALDLTGIQIAQAARVRLVNAVISEIDHGNTFLYCDTDSVVLIANKPVKLKVDKVGKTLGYWKCEGIFTSWFCLGVAKKYYLYNKHTQVSKLAFSGVDRKFKPLMLKLRHRELKIIFNHKRNVVVIKGKAIGKKTLLKAYQQMIFEASDIEVNSGLGYITHTLTLSKDGNYLRLRLCG